ncbi:unnamed protein product [Meloidogyne enterolobii]|uniref:Uncharacterized protein n=1 Tax=Meloidogyne enterolobii TaxID=390850 RepID=A0ACB0Z3E9_MELEN
MKLDSILIILIVNAIFWSLINSVKNNKEKNELSRVGETSKDNDEAESSVNAQIRMLNPKAKITKKGTTKDNKEEKKLNQRKYMRMWRQNNKEKIKEKNRKYREINKEKLAEYRQNNKENKLEYNRKYREAKKNKKETLQNIQSTVGDNGETSFVNTQNDFRDKGKLPVVYEEDIRAEEENLINLGEKAGNKDEAETNLDDQNHSVIEKPNKISENYMNQIDLNEHPFDLNEKPDDKEEDVY